MRAMKRLLRGWILVLSMGVLLIGCATPAPTPTPTLQPTPTPSPTATPEPTPTVPPLVVDLHVMPEERYQTLKDVVGGNFVHYFGGVQAPLDPVSTYTMETLRPRYGRVNMTLQDWEPVNDDADSRHFSWEGFHEENFIPATMGFLAILQERGGELIATAWDVPDWMVVDPSAEDKRRLKPELYPEVAESMAAWLLRAQEAYGVTVDYVSFNEATLGVNIVLTPDEYAALIGVAGPRFESLGLTTKWLLGDCHDMASCARYVSAIYAHEEIRPYLGPLAFHSWDASVWDGALTDMADFALANGLDIWCTEGGWDAQLWRTPDRYQTWTNALSLAAVYSRVLKLSRATVLEYWQMMGNDYAINDGTASFPIWHVLNQYATQFPEGTVIVGSTPDRSGLHILAGLAPDHFAVQVINKSMADFAGVIDGLPPGHYIHVQSSAEALDVVVGTYDIPGDPPTLYLPRGSVHILTTRADSVP